MALNPIRLLRTFTCSLATLGLVKAQTTATESYNTVTISGVETTYRAVFTVPASADEGQAILANVDDPEAVDAQQVCPGYIASEVVRSNYGFSATLTLAGEPCNVYGTDVDVLILSVEYQTADRLNVYIRPAYLDSSNTSQYILDENVIPKPQPDEAESSFGAEVDLQFNWANDPTFYFSVVRRSTGDVIFSTEGARLVYENQFIEFVTALPPNYNIQGLGDRISNLRLGNNFTATTWATDVGDPIDYNLYGTHPFYLDMRYYEVDQSTGNLTLFTSHEADPAIEYTSYAHGVFLRNAHGQEAVLRAENLTWRLLGGSIDLYFFSGPTPAEVTQQYLHTVGLPAMQQYWVLGYHQCRWGYANWTQLREVLDTLRAFEIPTEAIWPDIDYMYAYRDYTLDPITYPVEQSREFFERVHGDGQHVVPIVDAAIYIPNPENASDAYPTFDRGQALDVYIRNPDGSLYIGAVWPGYCVFPDYRSPNAVQWWVDELVTWYSDFAYDGVWLDMNEVASFCIGSCGSGNLTLNPVHPPFALPGERGNQVFNYPENFNLTNATEAASASAASASQVSERGTSTSSSTSYLRTTPTPGIRDVNYPPYAIKHVYEDLAQHAVSPNATHVDGVQEYDVHNLYGHQSINATYQALLQVFPGKRPFILGRSTFAGSGRYTAKWGGDNFSTFRYMQLSIPQILSFQLFGIPMFGTDTCGFNGNSNMELCNRWMQLAAFFPFYRNHNVLGAAPQEPYVWASVAEASRVAINIRYTLLPYWYTLFQLASTTGSTVMRALSWEFPNDPSLAGADRQFLVGPSILVTPVLNQGDTTVDGVFPGIGRGEAWYDWYTHASVNAQPGENVTIEAPLGHIPVYIRGGSCIPTQQPAYTTRDSRRNPWGLLVALSVTGTAHGDLYIDDGESLQPNATLWVHFMASQGSLHASATGEFVDTNPLANVTVMGVTERPGNVTLNGSPLEQGVDFNDENGVLSITGLEELTRESGAFGSDWTISWT